SFEYYFLIGDSSVLIRVVVALVHTGRRIFASTEPSAPARRRADRQPVREHHHPDVVDGTRELDLRASRERQRPEFSADARASYGEHHHQRHRSYGHLLCRAGLPGDWHGR